MYIFCISNTNKYDEYPLLQKSELKNQKILNNYKFVYKIKAYHKQINFSKTKAQKRLKKF